MSQRGPDAPRQCDRASRRRIEELRELAAGIHPPILTSRGLGAAINALARRSALVTVSAAIPDRLPEAVEANAYFLTAEALTNAVKHARATHIAVSMDCQDQTLLLEIQDDGIGGASLETGGTGLKSMADRATALGGRLTVSSPAREGTCVRAAFRGRYALPDLGMLRPAINCAISLTRRQ